MELSVESLETPALTKAHLAELLFEIGTLDHSITGKSHQSVVRWPKTAPIFATYCSRSRQGTNPFTSNVPPDGTSNPVNRLIVTDRLWFLASGCAITARRYG